MNLGVQLVPGAEVTLTRWYVCEQLTWAVAQMADAERFADVAAVAGWRPEVIADHCTATSIDAWEVVRLAALLGLVQGHQPEWAPPLELSVARGLADLIATVNHHAGRGELGNGVWTAAAGAGVAARLRHLVEVYR